MAAKAAWRAQVESRSCSLDLEGVHTCSTLLVDALQHEHDVALG